MSTSEERFRATDVVFLEEGYVEAEWIDHPQRGLYLSVVASDGVEWGGCPLTPEQAERLWEYLGVRLALHRAGRKP